MRKQRLLLVWILILSIAGGTVFLYNTIIIPRVLAAHERQLRSEIDDKAMPKLKVAVVADTSGISRYTVLSEEIIRQKIKFMEIPSKYVPPHAVLDMDQLKGKVTKEDLYGGTQVVSDNLSTEKKWFGEYDRLKEYSVSSIVAGEVKTGNIVDIIVTYDNGDYHVVVPKIKVRKLVDVAGAAVEGAVPPAGSTPNGKPAAGAVQKTGDKTNTLFTLILAIDEEQYRDLELAGKLGRFVTRLYIDENQTPSKKTFDFEKAQQKLTETNAVRKTAISDRR